MSTTKGNMQQNLLIYGDAVDSHSGLGRISRDLCVLSSTLPEFRVASYGRGALCSSRLPWPQYSFDAGPDQWGEHKLPKVWQDFTRGEGSGTILTVWDASRLLWFSGLTTLNDPALDTFLGPHRTFRKWGYFMVDGTGPDGLTLPTESRAVLSAYDRVLISSQWGAEVTRRSGIDCEWIPHPIDGRKFKYEDRTSIRERLNVQDKVVLGCVMTNQARKDWPTAFAIASQLANEYYGNQFLFWVHTDSPAFTPGAYWNLHALAADYNLPTECLRLTLTGNFTDSSMAAFYNACDVTILPSGGEGFGYPIAESLSCGCPCITQDYAAGAELTQPDWKIKPAAYRLDTSHNILRAVHEPVLWAARTFEVMEGGRKEGDEWRQEIAKSMEHLHIQNLKSVWVKWLREGVV